MAPIRTYSNWNNRSSNAGEQIEPYRHYYFICEGKNTEKWYFEKFIDIRKSLSIHSEIDISYLEKTEEHENLSSPKELIKFADEQKNGKIPFDPKFDKMIVVFDADIFENQQNNYEEIIELGKKRNILGVTNPSFELFLLLHFEGAVDEIILPDSENIIKNEWVGTANNRRRYIEDIFRKKAKMRPKSNMAIGELANHVLTAISQEKKLNNNIELCKGIVTSNIGIIIQSIIDDQCND
ncbi:RloB family protein [Anaerosporobacter sp.]|uniref:RloB family protein n=1 Tax=Anaerosporobacter sp. TaxID=1872529 RepID=UPI00286F46A3|nr:RloB family protein [Anaerosporobacter sp.]